MFGGSSAAKGEPQQVAPQAADDRFSLVELRRIYKQLVENKLVNEENQDLVIEILRVIAEMVVYGDNKSELLFDFFCEKSMLSLFLEIMNSDPVCPVPVHVQILQTLSILISCVKNDTSLYYLLSNNHINDILMFRHDFESDESLSAQFASFMKTLSLRLNDQTVQFFFREDTGAFPLLIKAVELLGSKDPMIRISAQSTILNIFRVNEHRALDYALREDNLFVLLECIAGIMRDQFNSLCQFSQAYLHSTTSAATVSADGHQTSIKIEQNMDDCIISIEDWIYYLQDVYDLNIEALQRALSSHLLNTFVYPVLLETVVDLKSTDGDSIESSTSRAARVDVAMFYLLQLGRIFPSPSLRRAVVTALSHPISQESRSVLVMHLHQHKSVREGEVDGGGVVEFSLPDDVVIDTNLFRKGLQHCLQGSHHQQKVTTLVLYALHGILQALFQDFKNEDISQGAHFFEKFLIGSGVFPYHAVADQPTGASNMWSEGISGDFLTVDELVSLRRLLQGAPQGIDVNPIVSSFLSIVQAPQKYSLANLQGACFIISYISHVVLCAGDINKVESSSTQTEQSRAVDEERPLRFSTADRLASIGVGVQEAIKIAAAVLLQRAESSLAEMLLVIVREEMERFQGRSWKEVHSRMFSEKGLLFPTPTSQVDVMGLDFSIPVSQVESVRKEVQIFLMLRALLHYLSTSLASYGDGKMSPFEFSTFIADCAFLSLEDDSIVPPSLKSGSPFDMKGKKFLDSTVILPPATDNATSNDGASTSSNITSGKAVARLSSSGSITASATSIFTFGLFGSSKAAANTPAAISNGKTGKDSLNGLALGPKLLFVQDPQVLQLISASKIDGKSVFKVHVVSPLLYVDAKLDLTNKRRLKIVVRSYKPISGMHKIDVAEEPPSISSTATPETSPKTHNAASSSSQSASQGHTSHFRPTVFLKPPRKANMYEIELMMDTEQAASLAILHVESRRRQLNVLKIEEFKKKVSFWLSDRRHWSDCIPNSES